MRSADRSRLSRAASEVWPRALARLDGEGASSEIDDENEVIPTQIVASYAHTNCTGKGILKIGGRHIVA